MSRLRLLAGAVCLLGLAAGISPLLGSKPTPPPAAPRLGVRAPDFDLADGSGQRWHLHDFTGTPVVLVFACGCAECGRLLDALARDARGPGHILVISSLPPTEISRLAARPGARFLGLFDPFSRTAIAYASTRCPRVWVIDKRQVVRYGSPPEQGNWQETLVNVRAVLQASQA